MSFNEEQTRAIKAPMTKDILISAGAGSGKTKTLSVRVSRLLKEEGLEPSELLILTFTDNAAHEMKERIIKELKGNYDRVDEMYSAHIQTFDSFSSYLVKKYASRLGISDQITIANKEVIDSKENSLLDAIFDEYYRDITKKDKFVKMLRKFNLQGDTQTKIVVLDLYHKLSNLTPSKKKDILEHYDEKYLSREVFDTWVNSFLFEAKEEIKKELYRIYLVSNYKKALNEPSKNIGSLDTLFSNVRNFTFSINESLSFEDAPNIDEIFPEIVKILNIELGEKEKNEEFISSIKDFYEGHKELLNKKNPTTTAIRNIFKGTNENVPSVSSIISISSLDDEFDAYISFKDDIHILLEIVRELDDRLSSYKKMSSFFTFSDISTFALRLLTEKQFADVAEEVRERFKYIMVDEYQDTNDFQEAFIDSLCKLNNKNERAHLFCVGDAKQSIYAFRNSNVALFRKRQDKYSDNNNEHEVIPMNKNYRSGKGLLSDINYIFDSYMTLTHGSICYRDESEQLQYDNKVNLYGKEYHNFGIYRLVSRSGDSDGWTSKFGNKGKYCQEWEARAICKDIQNKVKEGYQVYDRSIGGLRACKYSDFAILMRKKSGFELYQKIFNEQGVALNNIIASDLKEVDSVILLQSLVKMIAYLSGEGEDIPDPRHYFISIVRSYAFQYDDETIHRLISPQGENEMSLIKDDPVYKQLEEFVKKHKNAAFSATFLDLINEFHVIEKLYSIGNFEDNISKIESIYQLVVSSENAGQGLKEFVSLLLNINKYELDFHADSVFQSKDAVDMMTIHASKGLERKVVYLPYSFNFMATGGGSLKPDYFFNEKYGINLPNYILPDYGLERNVYNLAYRIASSAPNDGGNENDEHVRLFYVALTRAENTIYIVGDDYKKEEADIKNETLYGMLDYSTHYPVFAPGYLETIIKDKALIDRYNILIEKIKHLKYLLNIEDFSSYGEETDKFYSLYCYLFDEVYVKAIKNELSSIIEIDKKNESIKGFLFDYYFNQYSKVSSDLDMRAKLHDALETHAGISSFEEYLAFFNNTNIEDEIDEDASEDENLPFIKHADREELIATLEAFNKAVLDMNPAYFGISGNKKDENIIKFKNKLLPALAKTCGKNEPIMRISYKTDKYEDHVETIDVDMVQEKNEKKKVSFVCPKIEDDAIEFDEIIKKRASKKMLEDDETLTPVMEFGTELHRLLELYDFKKGDLSYIKDKQQYFIIKKITSSPIFVAASQADHLFQEYGYFDPLFRSNGFIDLLFEKDGHYTIVDYKTSNISDPAYVDQLHTYQRNIERIFNVDSSKISLYLLSITKGEIKEVPTLND